ncbi:MAG: aromatic amino acid transaminase [Hyphomicrobiales bacterium]
MLQTFKPVKADPLLDLITAFAGDRRREKVDLGVGMYRDENGRIPVMSAVRSAERRLAETQPSKSYLGALGNLVFLDRVADLVFGHALPDTGYRAAIQTTGGTAALRLAADVIHAANPDATIWLPEPAWGPHRPLFAHVGLRVEGIAFITPSNEHPDMEALLDGLETARPGDAIILQVCCHNPTGISLTGNEWADLTDLIEQKQLLPVLDLAYQGLGDGLDDDASALRLMVGRVPEMLVTVSCSKTFALYRERTGALFAVSNRSGVAKRVIDVAARAAGNLYYMPPDHGGAIVAEILGDADLTRQWRTELDRMRERLLGLRGSFASSHPKLAFLARGRGMFALLATEPERICRLRAERGLYIAPDGRINIAGLRQADITHVASLLAEAME